MTMGNIVKKLMYSLTKSLTKVKNMSIILNDMYILF
jgi:hypothetical protein